MAGPRQLRATRGSLTCRTDTACALGRREQPCRTFLERLRSCQRFSRYCARRKRATVILRGGTGFPRRMLLTGRCRKRVKSEFDRQHRWWGRWPLLMSCNGGTPEPDPSGEGKNDENVGFTPDSNTSSRCLPADESPRGVRKHPRGDSCFPLTGKSIAEDGGVLVGLLAAVGHRARGRIGAEARGHGESTEGEEADGDRKYGAVDSLHRVRLVGVIAEVFPHGSRVG